jgi:beta-phosphoglucomutase
VSGNVVDPPDLYSRANENAEDLHYGEARGRRKEYVTFTRGFPFCQELDYYALVFDWDGVLVDSGSIYYRAYERVLLDVGVSTTPREIYLREGQPTPQVLTAILNDRGVTVDEAGIKNLVERRREYDIAFGERKFFDGVCDLLRELREAHYRVGMVTGSSRKSVERVLTSDLRETFNVLITADDVQRPKPDPQPFLVAARSLDLEPAKCLVIENAPFGIRAAKAAGCGVVGICTTLPSEDLQEADWVVQNHGELEDLLKANHLPTRLERQGQTW